MAKIVNPNRPFSEEQLSALWDKFGLTTEIVKARVTFPLAADGGLAETAYRSALTYPDIEELAAWYPTGFATGAAAVMATLHGRYGSRFPDILIFGRPPGFPFLGTVELDAVRHQARETRYGPSYEGEEPGDLGDAVVLNFSHPFTDEQKVEIANLLGIMMEEVQFQTNLSIQYQYENTEELVAQVMRQVASVGLSGSDWQTQRIVVNLPAHSGGAMIALTEMHGRMGYFPTVLRVERADDGFHFTEVVDLEALRLRALTSDLEAKRLQMLKALEEEVQHRPTIYQVGETPDGRIEVAFGAGAILTFDPASAEFQPAPPPSGRGDDPRDPTWG